MCKLFLHDVIILPSGFVSLVFTLIKCVNKNKLM